MKNINRLAVVLVGELRTWVQASEYLFNFFDNASDNVDYFFVTWAVSSQTRELISVTEEDILSPFKKYKKNIISYKILEPIGRHRTTFYNQAWLSKVGNILKRKHEAENNFVYDQVIETRPDCYFRGFGPGRSRASYSNNGNGWPICKDYEYEGDIPRYNESINLPGMGDVYFRSNSFTSDIIADRYYFKRPPEATKCINYTHSNFTNHHFTITEFLFKRIMVPCTNQSQCDFSFFCCIRPNFPTDVNLDTIPPMELDQMFVSYKKQDIDFFYGPHSNLPLVDN